MESIKNQDLYIMIKKIIRLINPSSIISKLRYKFSDRYVISQQWKKYRMSYPLDLNNPQTFNEKIQWLKLNDRNPLYTTLVDKIKVKDYVADKIGVEYIIPTLAVYKSVEEIDLNILPNKFVLKCNHDSGSVIICRDINSFDLKSAKHNLNICLKV